MAFFSLKIYWKNYYLYLKHFSRCDLANLAETLYEPGSLEFW